MRKITLPVVATAALIGLSGATLGAAWLHHLPVTASTKASTTVRQSTDKPTPDQSAAAILRQVLPYYGQDTPSWCMEDMACWPGTSLDDRSPSQILTDLRCDLAWSAYTYGGEAVANEEDDPQADDVLSARACGK